MLSVKAFTFNPVQENSYILYNDAGNAAIIDPGCYFPAEEKELAAFIETNKLKPDLLLNTHCHFDHIFGNRFVAAKWQLIPHFHKNEQPVFDTAEMAADRWQINFKNYGGPVTHIAEGNKIMIGTDELSVLFAPGHSPGSVCFYCEKQGFVIGGDVLFNGSIGRTDLPGGDFSTLIQSIQTQLFVLPDETKVYSGHGPMTTIGYEKRNNPFVKQV